MNGPTAGPPLVPFQDHPGPVSGPPPTENKGEIFPPSALLIDINQREKLDRALSARSSAKPRDQIQRWREVITAYASKVCRVEYQRPIGADVVAMVMEACGDDEARFHQVGLAIQGGGSTRHDSPMWWVYVCLQRVQGIRPEITKARAAELAEAKRPRRIADSQAKPEPDNFRENFQQSIAAAAAGKRLK